MPCIMPRSPLITAHARTTQAASTFLISLTSDPNFKLAALAMTAVCTMWRRSAGLDPVAVTDLLQANIKQLCQVRLLSMPTRHSCSALNDITIMLHLSLRE
mgnify:CR=1 FL=1